MPFLRNVQHDIARFQASVLNNQFPHKPRLLHPQSMQDQLSRLLEETTEVRDAMHNGTLSELDRMVDIVDGLIDLMYFAAGWLHQMGIPFNDAWAIVHKANMQKVAGRTNRGQDNDAAKPDGWIDPKRELARMIAELHR